MSGVNEFALPIRFVGGPMDDQVGTLHKDVNYFLASSDDASGPRQVLYQLKFGADRNLVIGEDGRALMEIPG